MRQWWEWLIHITDPIEEWILTLTESLWVYAGLFGLALVDGIFPVVPSESVLIATATVSHQTGSPMLVLLFVAGAVGAWCGDQIAYLIGRRIDVRTWQLFRRPRWLRSQDWAENQLRRRGPTFIIAARFIPMGRVLVNLSAGALHYPHRRFMTTDAIAVSIWAAWSIALGTIAGALFPEDNLLLSIVIGVCAGVVIGLLTDKVLAWIGFEGPSLPHLVDEITAQPQEADQV